MKNYILVALSLIILLTSCASTPVEQPVEPTSEDSSISEIDGNEDEDNPVPPEDSGDSDVSEEDGEEIATPARQFLLNLREAFEENDIALYASTIGSGWDETTRSTTVIITKEIELWLFSKDKESEIFEIAVMATLPSDANEMELFALAFGVTNGATISVVDNSFTVQEGVSFQAELMSELSNNDLQYVEREVNGIAYELALLGNQFSLNIKIPTDSDMDDASEWDYENQVS